MSVEYILQHKAKEPYNVRSVHLEKEKCEKEKSKMRRKRKEKEEGRFNVPVFEFSRSNSLIVFSEKDSTINYKEKREEMVFPRTMTPVQAATLIQKTWRGYLTRQLLEQYINDEQHKIETAINYLKSKEESFFIEERQDEMDFSDFSEIQEETIAIDQKEVESSNDKRGAITTEHGSNSRGKCKESPTIVKNFFKNHRTEPDLE
jgi:hypothetical protein